MFLLAERLVAPSSSCSLDDSTAVSTPAERGALWTTSWECLCAVVVVVESAAAGKCNQLVEWSNYFQRHMLFQRHSHTKQQQHERRYLRASGKLLTLSCDCEMATIDCVWRPSRIATICAAAILQPSFTRNAISSNMPYLRFYHRRFQTS